MTDINEIAPGVYRISTFVPEIDLAFNQFLFVDDEPLLYHAGMRRMFPAIRDAMAGVMDPARLRWVGMSHFEADECGAMNEWLGIAPSATPVCTKVAAMVNLEDFAARAPRSLAARRPMDPQRPEFGGPWGVRKKMAT
jgi:flavorubredoxin